MEIRKAKEVDSEKIAKIHQEEIRGGFLSSLGVNFLNVLYLALIKDPNSLVLVAERGQSVIGFVVATKNLRKVYLNILKNNVFTFFGILFKKILNPKNLKKVFETLLYPNKLPEGLPEAEILSIAVRKQDQSCGVGTSLLREAKNNLKDDIKIAVGQELIVSQKMLSKIGAVLVTEVEIHSGSKTYIYQF